MTSTTGGQSTTTKTVLTPEERERILARVYRELFVACPPPGGGEPRSVEGAAAVTLFLDGLVDIVRRTTATRVEPYQAQVLDEICSKCPEQSVTGHCPQRFNGPCVVFRFAAPIVRAVGAALREMGDEEYLARRRG